VAPGRNKQLGKDAESPPSHNLPIPPTPLIGRQNEVVTASNLLLREDVRLLTLTGPPGIGKTRLAIEIATRLLTYFADGVYFINLAPITEAHLILPTVAHALDLRQVTERPLVEELTGFLVNQRVLLVLDNFEQVIQIAPALIDLLQGALHLKLLVTSRELLRVSGEHNFPVPPLPLPPVLTDQGAPRTLASLPPGRISQFDAVQLFVQRAVALRPDFALTLDNALMVAGICCRLDGLPLAIELAAARVRHLPPQEIYERLQNRLHILTRGTRDLPVRQRTLRAAIEWSYELLDPDETALFRQLAVFQNGATLEAVEAISRWSGDLGADTLSLMASLVDKSLLRQVEGVDQTPRFVMLETIHEYASERLHESGESQSMRRYHAQYFLILAEQAEPELRRAQQKLWLHRLEDDHDNLRAALKWALETTDGEMAGRLGAALWRFWQRRSHLAEGREWLEQILVLGARVPSTLRAQMLAGSGFLAFLQGNYTTGRALEEESLKLYQEIGDKTGIALAFTYLADLEYVLGDAQPEMAIARFEQALALWREAGDRPGIAKALSDLGEAARTIGDFQAARARYEESLTIRRELGDSGAIAVDLQNLGHVAHHEGDYKQARQLFTESLLISSDLGNKHTASDALRGLAGVAARMGQPRRAALLFGAAEAVLQSFAGRSIPVDWADYEDNLAVTRSQLDEESWEKLWAAGQAMTFDEAIAFAQTVADSDEPSASGARPDGAFHLPHGLTRRELEVALLIAAGKSNREIADAFVIAERTVEGHVSNVLSKLGFRSRTQVSIWVNENRLSNG
jgi:predicted ATPase/DNA-binding CsgD family transcriptional regulator